MGSGCIDPRFLYFCASWVELSVAVPNHFTPLERDRGTLWIGGCVDPKAGVDDIETRKFLTLPGLKLRPLRRTTRGQFLYVAKQLLKQATEE
jgi:hypothetical protein